LSSIRTRELFLKIKRIENRIELSTGKIQEGKPGSVCFPTNKDTFTFQQDNNLKHKAKCTLVLLSKMTFNVPELPSYGFDLNQLGNLW
jgi:hypothetical protein